MPLESNRFCLESDNIYFINSITSFLRDSIWLPAVLSHFRVNKVDNVWSDGCTEHSRESDIVLCGLPLLIVDTDERSCCCCSLRSKMSLLIYYFINGVTFKVKHF